MSTVTHHSENFEAIAVVKHEKTAWVEHNLNRYYPKLSEGERRTALELVHDKCVSAVNEANNPKETTVKGNAPKGSTKPKGAAKNRPVQQVSSPEGGEEDSANTTIQ